MSWPIGRWSALGRSSGAYRIELHRRDQVHAIFGRPADPPVDRPCLQVGAGIGTHQVRDGVRRRIQPALPIGSLNNDRHPVVHGRHQLIRRAGDDAGRADNGSIRCLPGLPESAEGKRAVVLAGEVIRLLGLAAVPELLREYAEDRIRNERGNELALSG